MASDTVAKYAGQLYALMEERAETSKHGELLYTGIVTDLYRELGASSAYYSRIRSFLLRNESIEFIQRGNRVQPSVVRLRGAPPDEDGDLTRPATPAKMVAELERRLAAVEAWRETVGGINIADALRNMEQRLAKLERMSLNKREE